MRFRRRERKRSRSKSRGQKLRAQRKRGVRLHKLQSDQKISFKRRPRAAILVKVCCQINLAILQTQLQPLIQVLFLYKIQLLRHTSRLFKSSILKKLLIDPKLPQITTLQPFFQKELSITRQFLQQQSQIREISSWTMSFQKLISSKTSHKYINQQVSQQTLSIVEIRATKL